MQIFQLLTHFIIHHPKIMFRTHIIRRVFEDWETVTFMVIDRVFQNSNFYWKAQMLQIHQNAFRCLL